MVKVAADELGSMGIRVNAVRPGLTRTATTERSFTNETMLASFLAQQPIPRGGQVADIANAVRYLAGPESGWVTGQHLTVDGGHTLRAFIDYAAAHPTPRPAPGVARQPLSPIDQRPGLSRVRPGRGR